ASYLVVCFWSQDASDPLDGAATLGDFEAQIDRLGWAAPPLPKKWVQETRAKQSMKSGVGLPGKTPSSAFPLLASSGDTIGIASDPGGTGARQASVMQEETLYPKKTLLHGAVLGVPFSGEGPDLRPGPESIDLGIGASGMAALASLLSSSDSDERLLSA